MKKILLAALLLAVVAFWGATFLIVQRATSQFSVLGFLGLRFGVASLCVGVLAMRQLELRAIRTGLLIGLALASAYLLQTYGLRTTTSTNSGLITGMFIVFVPLMSRILFGIRTGFWPCVGIVVSVAGLVLLTGGATMLQRGDVLTVFCAACFGFQVSLLDHYAPRHSTGGLVFGQLSAVAIVCLSAWWLLEAETIAVPSRSVLYAILATGLVGSAIACFVQTLAQRHLSAIETALIIMTEPVFAAMVGRVWGHEILTEVQWMGAGLIVAAMALVSLQPMLERRMPRRDAVVAGPE